MGLLANGWRDKSGVYQTFGATASNNAYPSANPANYARTGAMRNLTAGQGIADEKVGLPSGYRHPSCWMMPQRGGALASRNIISGSGAFVSDGTMGVNGEAALTGSGSLSGTGALIVSLVAALTGSGTITSANAIAFLNLAAALAGTGDLAGAASAIAHAAAALDGEGSAAGTATALGTLAAEIVVTGELLNTANVGSAVWAAIASVNNTTGTMGEKLNDAGSASNPWTEVIESGLTAAEILRIVAAVLAGKVSGAGSGTETFVGLDGATDRVVSTNDSAGNRTSVVVDGS